VIVSALTFVASVDTIIYAGLTPVLADARHAARIVDATLGRRG
jgi:dTDP-4-amino-4,6-dideoxygalactose transaminase